MSEDGLLIWQAWERDLVFKLAARDYVRAGEAHTWAKEQISDQQTKAMATRQASREIRATRD